MAIFDHDYDAFTAGQRSILDRVRQLPSPVTGVLAMDDYRYCKWCGRTWRGDTHPPSLTCLWPEANKEQS